MQIFAFAWSSANRRFSRRVLAICAALNGLIGVTLAYAQETPQSVPGARGPSLSAPVGIGPATATVEFVPGKYRLRMSSTQAEGKGLCTVNSTQELTVLAGNRFAVNYWRDVQTTVSPGGEAFLEFSKLESNGDTTFTMKGLAGSRGYSGVLAVSSSSSYGCFGSGEWSLERLDAGPVREPPTAIAQTAAPGTPQVTPPQTSKVDPPPQKVQVAPTPEKQTVETKLRPADESARPLAPQSGPAPALPAIVTKPVTVPAPAVTARSDLPSEPQKGSTSQLDPGTLERLRLLEERFAKLNQDAAAQVAAAQAAATQAAAAQAALKLSEASRPSPLRRSAYALVIGNSRYPASPLPNAVSDARAVSVRLRSFGIDVETVLDADRSKLVTALANFSNKVFDSDIAILFYAGHGVQINGVNFLLPIDLDLAGPAAAITLHGIPLSTILESYLPSKTKLIFLDACRDNPLARSLAGRGAGRGLAPMDVATGTLISYATKDGNTAEDGFGANSPYTTALLEHLGEDEDISLVLRRVRQKVMAVTKGRQQPWEYGSLIGDKLVLSQIAK